MGDTGAGLDAAHPLTGDKDRGMSKQGWVVAVIVAGSIGLVIGGFAGRWRAEAEWHEVMIRMPMNCQQEADRIADDLAFENDPRRLPQP
jgi:hypothetical protein